MALTRLSGFLPLLLVAGCGTQYSDPIRTGAVEPADPCVNWTTESECLADTAQGCSFQPNLIGCRTDDPGCTAGTCRGGDPFVRRSGQTLWLHDAPYRFLGAVSWGIAWSEGCRIGSQPTQEDALRRTFDDLAGLRASALKFWAFQSFAGPTGDDFTNFERIVAAARRAGVRLIFVLENHWESCTPGLRDAAWYSGGYAAPYGGYALSYEDYVTALVDHFRNEPTVLAWELMHEASGDDFAALDHFAREVPALVRSRDPNHLVVLGSDNGTTAATSREGDPSNFLLLHEYEAIDMIDAHDFSESDDGLTSSMAELAAIAAALEKPMFAGATAVSLADVSAAAFAQRASVVEDKIEAAFVAGAAGFLAYDYYPDWPDASWQFDARTEEPLAGSNGVFVRHAPERH